LIPLRFSLEHRQSSTAINTTSINFDSPSSGDKDSETFFLPGSLTANCQRTHFISKYGDTSGACNDFALHATNVVILAFRTLQAYFGP
jgi:hypothetical protein